MDQTGSNPSNTLNYRIFTTLYRKFVSLFVIVIIFYKSQSVNVYIIVNYDTILYIYIYYNVIYLLLYVLLFTKSRCQLLTP